MQSLRQECAQLRQENARLKQGIVQSESEVNTMNWCWSAADFVPLEQYMFDDGDLFAGDACRTGH